MLLRNPNKQFTFLVVTASTLKTNYMHFEPD